MTPEIERLAKEAGIAGDSLWLIGEEIPEFLAKFAALIADDCAKRVESMRFMTLRPGDPLEVARVEGMRIVSKDLARAIRAKFALSDKEDAAK